MENINSRENLIRLIEQYQNLVFSICLRMTGDYFTAEDITQDTFVAAFKNLNSFDGKNEKAWICRIASNKCIDYMKSARLKDVALDVENISDIPGSEEPLKEIINKEVMKDFEKAVMRLDEPYRSVAKEHFIDGKTAKQISEEKQIGLKTIQTHIYRAKAMLKNTIRKEDLIT